MLETYRAHVAERAGLGLPPLPLNAEQAALLVELIKQPPTGEEDFLLDLLKTASRPAWIKPRISKPRSSPTLRKAKWKPR